MEGSYSGRVKGSVQSQLLPSLRDHLYAQEQALRERAAQALSRTGSRLVVAQLLQGPRSLCRYQGGLRGFIVGTRFATEARPHIPRTKIFSEDPETPGDAPFTEGLGHDIGNRVIALHYGGIAQKLAQPILAAALTGGFRVPDEIGFPATVWEFRTPPLEGKRFEGGIYPYRGQTPRGYEK